LRLASRKSQFWIFKAPSYQCSTVEARTEIILKWTEDERLISGHECINTFSDHERRLLLRAWRPADFSHYFRDRLCRVVVNARNRTSFRRTTIIFSRGPEYTRGKCGGGGREVGLEFTTPSVQNADLIWTYKYKYY